MLWSHCQRVKHPVTAQVSQIACKEFANVVGNKATGSHGDKSSLNS